jgi:hypothetical protein
MGLQWFRVERPRRGGTPNFPISPTRRGVAQKPMLNFRFNPPKHSDNNTTGGVMPAHAMEDSI